MDTVTTHGTDTVTTNHLDLTGSLQTVLQVRITQCITGDTTTPPTTPMVRHNTRLLKDSKEVTTSVCITLTVTTTAQVTASA